MRAAPVSPIIKLSDLRPGLSYRQPGTSLAVSAPTFFRYSAAPNGDFRQEFKKFPVCYAALPAFLAETKKSWKKS
jgi:hypothetical protein